MTGAPGDLIDLDARIQSVTDITHNSTLPDESVTGVPYRVYRLQMPVDQLAWDVAVTPVAGNPNVAVRRDMVPSEIDNDAYSEAADVVTDSLTLVPPTLSDGTWFITVYGAGSFTYSLKNGVPVITPMNYIDAVTNDLTTKSGWRYYGVTDINSQLGTLGWELLLASQVPGTEIAIRRNAVPGRWNRRSSGNSPTFSDTSSGHVDASANDGWLQHPAHQADIWYVGIYTPNAALGAVELTTREITPTGIAFNASSLAVSDHPEGKWNYYRVTVPANALGLDVWAKDVTSGDPRLVVRRDQLPAAVATTNNWWPQNSGTTTWPSGNAWCQGTDWTHYGKDPGTSDLNYRRLVAAVGAPMEPGTYYIGVYNNADSGTAAYTLLSRGIGAAGSGCELEATPLAFTGGSSSIANLEPRDGRFFKVTIPTNTRSWQVHLAQTTGELCLIAAKNHPPNISWNRGGEALPAWNTLPGMSQPGDEYYHLLPKDGAAYLEPGDYYLAVVSQGVNPGTNYDEIGTGTSSGTIESIGEIPVTNLGTASATTINQPDTLAAGEIKIYQVEVPDATSVLEVVTDDRVGNPRVSVVAGLAAPQPNDQYYNYYGQSDAYGWDYGQTTGRFFNDEHHTGNNPDVATIEAPASGTYTIVVRANPIDNSNNDNPAPASYTLNVRTRTVGLLNFDAAQNGNGGTHTATSQLFKKQTDYYAVTVPVDFGGADIVGWRLAISHTLGDTSFRISTDFADWSQAITITGNSATIVPPFLTPGNTYYVAVTGEQSAEYTISSSNLSYVLPPWPMPIGDNNEFGDSGAGLGGDMGRDLANGTWDYYAVDVPDGNTGLLRTVLEAINGDPNLYIREDGAPTLDHNADGQSGGTLFHRSMLEPTTQYGNWVPLQGRTDHQLRPGRWVLGVRADGGSNARYRLRVTTASVTDLALDGASVTNQQLAGGDWRYYRFTVPEDAPLQWLVSFYQQQGDVVMHIRDSLPPGHGNYVDGPEYIHINAFKDAKNQGPYEDEGYDAEGTHDFSVPWLRPGHTYYLGFRAKSDSTFSLQTSTSSTSIGVLPELDYTDGGIDDTLAAGEARTFLVRVPADATRFKYTSTHTANVEIRIEQGTLPNESGDAHHASTTPDESFNYQLMYWPWVPNQRYYVTFINHAGSPEPLVFALGGRTGATEDEDADGLPDEWELAWFPGLWSSNADENPAGDGVSNLLKYAFNLDPTCSDLHQLTQGTGSSGLPAVHRDGSGTSAVLVVEYVRRKNLSGWFDYSVVTSPTMSGSWSAAGGSATVTDIAGQPDWERVVHTIPANPAIIPRNFCRVVVLSHFAR